MLISNNFAEFSEEAFRAAIESKADEGSTIDTVTDNCWVEEQNTYGI